MSMSTIFTLSILLASPASVLSAYIPFYGYGLGTRCDISNAVLTVPPGQEALVEPTTPPSFIGLGVGTQNYTCSADTSKYV